jgi:hypothetical protein
MKKYTWTTNEMFVGRVQVAHYGPVDMDDAQVSWTVTDSQGRKIAGDAFDKVSIAQGTVFEVDMFSLALSRIPTPHKLRITLAIEGTPYRNDYPIWIYAPNVNTHVPKGVLVTAGFTSAKTQAHLEAGGKVLLLPKLNQLPHSIEGGFQCEFWSPMFAVAARKRGIKPPPGTLGFLCDPNAPALAAFPTEFHSNWQWWHLIKNARPIILDDSPDSYRPTVQMIDNFVTNHKLGLIAETKVGKGKMLICAIDLLSHQDKPEARQLLHSLLQYTGSPAFTPEAEIDIELLNRLLPGDAP